MAFNVNCKDCGFCNIFYVVDERGVTIDIINYCAIDDHDVDFEDNMDCCNFKKRR